MQIQKNILAIERIVRGILCSNKDENKGFFNKYLHIEEIARRDLKIPIVYKFKERGDCQLVVYSKNNHISIAYRSNDINLEILPDQSLQEIQELCCKLDQQIQTKRLYFSPTPDQEFVNDLLAANIGDIFCYNTRNSFVCIDDKAGSKKFRYAFSGNIKEVCLENFNIEEEFVVKDKDSHDLKFMYSLAYSSESSSVSRRKYDYNALGGYTHLVKLEEEYQNKPFTVFEIGNYKLRLVNSELPDGQTVSCWYSPEGHQIPRDKIGLMFAWAKTVSADIEMVDENWMPNRNTIGNEYENINNAISSHNVEKMLDAIYECCRVNNNFSSVSFSGLCENDNNFTPVTFAFSYDEQGLSVFKCIYEKDSNAYVESSQDEFLAFYKQRYQSVKNITLQQYKNYSPKEQDIIFKEIVKKSSNNSKGIIGKISSEERSQINKMLNSYLEDKRNGREYAPIKDIVSEKHIHTSGNDKSDLSDEVIEKD